MASKKPYIHFYHGDWLKDPELAKCSPSTRGIWIDFLCAMHESDRSGQITGTREQLARVGRCTTVELEQALSELKSTNAAEVCNGRNDLVTVINRRMKRECNAKEKAKLRVEKCRNKRKCNADVTPELPKSNNPMSLSLSLSYNNDLSVVSLTALQIQQLQEEFGSDTDFIFYQKKFLKPGLKDAFSYFKRCLTNEPKPLRTIQKPPQKKFPIPEGYEMTEERSPNTCFKCKQITVPLFDPRYNEYSWFCEYCGNHEAEDPKQMERRFK